MTALTRSPQAFAPSGCDKMEATQPAHWQACGTAPATRQANLSTNDVATVSDRSNSPSWVWKGDGRRESYRIAGWRVDSGEKSICQSGLTVIPVLGRVRHADLWLRLQSIAASAGIQIPSLATLKRSSSLLRITASVWSSSKLMSRKSNGAPKVHRDQ